MIGNVAKPALIILETLLCLNDIRKILILENLVVGGGDCQEMHEKEKRSRSAPTLRLFSTRDFRFPIRAWVQLNKSLVDFQRKFYSICKKIFL